MSILHSKLLECGYIRAKDTLIIMLILCPKGLCNVISMSLRQFLTTLYDSVDRLVDHIVRLTCYGYVTSQLHHKITATVAVLMIDSYVVVTD